MWNSDQAFDNLHATKIKFWSFHFIIVGFRCLCFFNMIFCKDFVVNHHRNYYKWSRKIEKDASYPPNKLALRVLLLFPFSLWNVLFYTLVISYYFDLHFVAAFSYFRFASFPISDARSTVVLRTLTLSRVLFSFDCFHFRYISNPLLLLISNSPDLLIQWWSLPMFSLSPVFRTISNVESSEWTLTCDRLDCHWYGLVTLNEIDPLDYLDRIENRLPSKVGNTALCFYSELHYEINE